MGTPVLIDKKTAKNQKFSRALGQKVIDLIRLGSYKGVACAAVGLSRRTFAEWMAIGEGRLSVASSTKEYEWFAQEIHKAEAECETTLIKNLMANLPKETREIIEFLARRWPERWAKRDGGKVKRDSDDWVTEFKRLYEAGEITQEEIIEKFGKASAEQWFAEAGITLEQEVE
jgi:hypothetical protein